LFHPFIVHILVNLFIHGNTPDIIKLSHLCRYMYSQPALKGISI